LGTVWQDERYDRLVRNEEEFQGYWEYIRNNPIKAGFSTIAEDYPFFWQIPK
jgi:putative transposase